MATPIQWVHCTAHIQIVVICQPEYYRFFSAPSPFEQAPSLHKVDETTELCVRPSFGESTIRNVLTPLLWRYFGKVNAWLPVDQTCPSNPRHTAAPMVDEHVAMGIHCIDSQSGAMQFHIEQSCCMPSMQTKKVHSQLSQGIHHLFLFLLYIKGKLKDYVSFILRKNKR